MTITRRLSALEAQIAPGVDAESELFGQYIAMSEGISYEELRAEAERIMRAHPGESTEQITAAIALEQGVTSAEIVVKMEATMQAARAWAAGNTAA